MGYWYLVVAIISEVVATSALNASQGFTRLWPSVATVIGYCVAFFFKQLPDAPAVLGMLFIIVGVVLVSAVSRTAGH